MNQEEVDCIAIFRGCYTRSSKSHWAFKRLWKQPSQHWSRKFTGQ